MQVFSALIIIDLSGWDESASIKHEISFFSARRQAIAMIGDFAQERSILL
jgi:hypothetical protein